MRLARGWQLWEEQGRGLQLPLVPAVAVLEPERLPARMPEQQLREPRWRSCLLLRR